MLWQECSEVDERLRFVARLLEGEKMTGLCREFDISRKTGYKILTRYQKTGLEGLTVRPSDRIGRPIDCRNWSNRALFSFAGSTRLGCPEDPREA